VDAIELEERADFAVLFPDDPMLGAPDATYYSNRGEVALVWAPTDDLPPTIESDIGLLIMQFRGSVSPEPIGKIISSGTTVEPVRIADGGYWIEGDPHTYFYISPEGEHIEEGRRWVGDALIWQDGEMTYRIETALGKDAAIRIAESLQEAPVDGQRGSPRSSSSASGGSGSVRSGERTGRPTNRMRPSWSIVAVFAYRPAGLTTSVNVTSFGSKTAANPRCSG
jgi:hypothetical protein